jgi:hypothetical protein
METLGSLCDKLIVVELKIFHTDDVEETNLHEQRKKLCEEIDQYVVNAVVRKIDPDNLTFDANKVYDKDIVVPDFVGGIGTLLVTLFNVNCEIWHDVDKSYLAETIPADELCGLVKRLAVLNLHRNKCIDAINTQFKGQVLL